MGFSDVFPSFNYFYMYTAYPKEIAFPLTSATTVSCTFVDYYEDALA